MIPNKKCSWRSDEGERTIIKVFANGRHTEIARATCSGCGCHEDVNMTHCLPDNVLDKKIRQRGWDLDPALCPDCQKTARKTRPTTHTETEMAEATVTPITESPSKAAVRGQIAAFRALDEHFNVVEGRYQDGWNDERIAKESGLPLQRIIDYRIEGFGELSLPSEYEKLSADVASLGKLVFEMTQTFSTEVNALKHRLADMAKQVRR